MVIKFSGNQQKLLFFLILKIREKVWLYLYENPL